jgi:argininosuccinate lyase
VAKIWDKGYSVDALLERFTVGEDYLFDRRLIASDAVASIAHAQMLGRAGILSQTDVDSLVPELRAIAAEAFEHGIVIERAQEDSHTAIEARLVEKLGESGKRIHTGRSRNDQVLASTRLFAREGLVAVREAVADTANALLALAERDSATPMVGRTHLQPAMPSTVGLWASSHAELLLDAERQLAAAFELVDRGPLGAAAGYGVPLPVDRESVSDALGFAGLQHNVLATVSSRGQVELAVLDALDGIGIALSRLATDLIIFTMPEFGYFTLPDSLTTGSSIMPQKKNPDGLELLRGKSGVLSSYADRVRGIVRSLPAGYNRDTQETKEPLIRGIDLTLDMLAAAGQSVSSLTVHPDRLAAAFDRGVLATDRALDLVSEGMSFRDAYQQVAQELARPAEGPGGVSGEQLAQIIARRTATGTPGNLALEGVRKRVGTLTNEFDQTRERIGSAVEKLLGSRVALYPGTPANR